MIQFKLLLFCLLALFATSCGDQSFYEKNVSIADRSWSYNNIPRFDVEITDKNAKYDIWVNIRHTGNYNYSNLFFLVHEKGTGLKDTAYRHEMKLAELDGRWTGKNAGSLYENQQLIKENFSFPDTGKYIFSIEQNMRENPLRDINDIGIKLVKK